MSKPIDFHFPGQAGHPSPDAVALDFLRRYHIGSEEDIETDEYPDYAYFRIKGTEKKQNALRDIVTGYNGFVVVSGDLFNVLQSFELGKTRFKRIPLLAYDRKTLISDSWYFVHFREERNCFVPSQSTGLVSQRGPDSWTVDDDSNFHLAVDPSAAEGVDIWGDRSAVKMMFFSERLHKAITSANLNVKGMCFRRCKVI
ncbi:imm11 family protein [Shimia sp.]|uniref:imm11 family protein n=1 Tax=Shimia sp. TaxID=1954381 RepID=UPI003BAD2DEF